MGVLQFYPLWYCLLMITLLLYYILNTSTFKHMCNKLAKSQKLLSWRKLVTFTEKTCWDTKRLLKYKINTIDVLKLQIVKRTCTKCHLSFSLSNLIYSFRPVYKFTWYGVIKIIIVKLVPLTCVTII